MFGIFNIYDFGIVSSCNGCNKQMTDRQTNIHRQMMILGLIGLE